MHGSIIMEMDARLIVLTILYALTRAHEGDRKADLTDQLLFHCTWCLKNISLAACRVLGNGTISCVRCKEHVQDGLLCSKCANTGLNSNDTALQGLCETCLCNGSFDSSQLTDCNQSGGKCVTCQSDGSRLDCKNCVDSSHDAKSFRDNCVTENDKVEVDKVKKSGFSTKEKIIVAVCSAFGVVCLVMIAFLISRHFKSRRFSVKKPFWTVELTNRNYDDLDFSLLDPITDIPLVYRADIGEFDNDALLGAEKPQVIMDIDGANAVS